jgi:hypothetical protein
MKYMIKIELERKRLRKVNFHVKHITGSCCCDSSLQACSLFDWLAPFLDIETEGRFSFKKNESNLQTTI